MYNKLFSKILDSSIWLESDHTRIVWITFLAAMDEDGFCPFASVKNLARRANVPDVESVQKAVEVLEGPDPDSSDPEFEGRRIERVPGGWMVLNAAKYRAAATRESIREGTRRRVAAHRARKKGNATVTACNDNKQVVMQSYTDTDTDTNKESCAAASAAPAIELPLVGKQGDYQVSSADVETWRKLYPAIDVMQELRGMVGWLLANPKNQKTRSGIKRFVNAWLARSQNGARVSAASGCGGTAAVGARRPSGAYHGEDSSRFDREPDLVVDSSTDETAEIDHGAVSAWATVQRALEKTVSRHAFETWLKPTKGASISGSVLVVKVPTKEFEYVEKRFGEEIERHLPPGIATVRFVSGATA